MDLDVTAPIDIGIDRVYEEMVPAIKREMADDAKRKERERTTTTDTPILTRPLVLRALAMGLISGTTGLTIARTLNSDTMKPLVQPLADWMDSNITKPFVGMFSKTSADRRALNIAFARLLAERRATQAAPKDADANRKLQIRLLKACIHLVRNPECPIKPKVDSDPVKGINCIQALPRSLCECKPITPIPIPDSVKFVNSDKYEKLLYNSLIDSI